MFQPTAMATPMPPMRSTTREPKASTPFGAQRTTRLRAPARPASSPIHRGDASARVVAVPSADGPGRRPLPVRSRRCSTQGRCSTRSGCGARRRHHRRRAHPPPARTASLVPVRGRTGVVHRRATCSPTTTSGSSAGRCRSRRSPTSSTSASSRRSSPGFLLLIRRRERGADRASLIDSLVIATGVGLLSWVFLMAPYAHDATLSTLGEAHRDRLPVDGPPAADGCRPARLRRRQPRPRPTTWPSRRSSSSSRPTAIYGWQQLHGGYQPGGLLDGGWILFYLLFGAAALHPSMAVAVEAAAGRCASPGPGS